MERVVKFKGYSEQYERWMKGFYVKHPDGTCYISAHFKGGQWVEVVPESVGEFTGVLDLNNEEVYEGDIVKYNNFINWKDFNGLSDDRNLGLVIFNNSGYNCKYGFCIKMLELVYTCTHYHVSKIEPMNITNAAWGLEVVGNIYSDKLKDRLTQ